jgi:hypothetical membrane protein
MMRNPEQTIGNLIDKQKVSFIQWLGLLGIVSLLSYTAAVVFSPLAYPGYDWMSQAVSDLSAANAPSLTRWNQLNSLYSVCGIVCATLVCVFVQGKLSRTLRIGIYLFTAMEWISDVGYAAFPLSGGEAALFQDTMHMVVTALTVLLSVAALGLIMIGGYRGRRYMSLGLCATIALALMFAGAIGTGAAPKEIFGVFERFSVFSAAGFNAVLGMYLFRGFKGDKAA